MKVRAVWSFAIFIYKFLLTGFPNILPHISLLTGVVTVPDIYSKVIQTVGCSFAFDSPTVLNTLPCKVCASLSIASFRKKLKTHL